MAARLGHERAEVKHHVEADGIALIDLGDLRFFAQARVLVDAAVLQRCEPRVVVDAGALPLKLRIGHVEELGEQPRRPLNAVAEADDRLAG